MLQETLWHDLSHGVMVLSAPHPCNNKKPHVLPSQTGTETSKTKGSSATANSLHILSKTLGLGKAIIKIHLLVQ